VSGIWTIPEVRQAALAILAAAQLVRLKRPELPIRRLLQEARRSCPEQIIMATLARRASPDQPIQDRGCALGPAADGGRRRHAACLNRRRYPCPAHRAWRAPQSATGWCDGESAHHLDADLRKLGDQVEEPILRHAQGLGSVQQPDGAL
jgi:hypothetical protein